MEVRSEYEPRATSLGLHPKELPPGWVAERWKNAPLPFGSGCAPQHQPFRHELRRMVDNYTEGLARQVLGGLQRSALFREFLPDGAWKAVTKQWSQCFPL